MTTEPTPRPRRIDPAAKRAAVLEAAARLFARDGYSATTTAGIAREAGVATGTVFRLFPDKAALLAALHLDIETRFAECMAEAWDACDAPAAERFEPMYRALFALLAELRERMPIMALGVAGAGAAAREPGSVIKARIEAQYARAVAAGELRSLPRGAVVHIVSGMVDGAMRHWLASPTARRRQEAIRTLTEISLRAFAP